MASTARGFLGAGDLYIARFNPVAQAFEDYAGPFEVTRFEITPNSELKEMISRGRSTYGRVIESAPIPSAFEFGITMPEVNKESLALALLGTTAEISQGSGTVTGSTIQLSAARMDKWVDLAHANIGAAGVSVTSNDGVDVYVEGTDYAINRRLGTIKFLSTGDVPTTENVKIDYTYAAVSGSKIAGATQSQVRAKFRLDGVNFVDQSSVIVDVFEGVMTPDGSFDFMQDDFAEVSLKGRLKTPAGRTEPFEVRFLEAA